MYEYFCQSDAVYSSNGSCRIFAQEIMTKIFSIMALSFLFGFFPLTTNAATLSFSNPADLYNVGSTFTVNVYVESSDQAMNAASGAVSFPWTTLEVVSLSKVGSIFSLWPEEPSFSNKTGTVNFEGVAPNPGFTGANGKILSITFRAKTAGTANVSFSSGSVLANDGTGMNILTGSRVAVVNIGAKSSLPPVSGAKETISEDNAPIIISSTHPDQTKWYKNNRPEFSWALPSNTLEVRTLIGTLPKSEPTIGYAPPISNKKINTLSDGTYYFHLQIRTSAGWSGVAHYRVNIDTTPPKEFSITFPHGTKGLEPQPIILFNTTDSGSGVSHYDIKVGDGGPERMAPIAVSNPYSLPAQYPGTYTVTVAAVDRAGNTTNASADFMVEGIEAPVITSYSKVIESGDLIKIRGTTYENSDITVLIKQDAKVVSEENTRSNSLGDFVLIVTKRLDAGVYTFTAHVTDGRGARSNETKPQLIEIKSRFFADFMTSVLTYLSVIILAALALLGTIVAGLVTWRQLSQTIRRLRREGMEAEEVLEKSFAKLRSDIVTHIALLKTVRSRRQLTKEELLFLEEFRKSLAEAEKNITKEIRDVS